MGTAIPIEVDLTDIKAVANETERNAIAQFVDGKVMMSEAGNHLLSDIMTRLLPKALARKVGDMVPGGFRLAELSLKVTASVNGIALGGSFDAELKFISDQS